MTPRLSPITRDVCCNQLQCGTPILQTPTSRAYFSPLTPVSKHVRMKSLLITGCSSGIGLDTARRLHAEGWAVFASCRQQADVDRLRAEGLNSLLLDHNDSDSIRRAVADVLEATEGRLDAVFVNGAYAIPGRMEDMPRDAMRAIFETNLFGPIELVNAVLPAMRAADAGRGRGKILLCSSVLGFAAMPWRGAYNSTKFAMEGWADTLRLELDGSGIDVVLIQPGPIATRIRENSIPHFEQWIDIDTAREAAAYRDVLMPRLYEPGERKDRFELPPSAVSDAVVHALTATRPKLRYRITVPTRVGSWLKRLLPARLMDRVLLGKPG